MAHRAPASSTTQIRALSRPPSEQMEQGLRVSGAPQTEQDETFSAVSASEAASGTSSWSRFFSRASAARRAERGPMPGSLASRLISRSISGPAEAAKSEEFRHAGNVHSGHRSGGLAHQGAVDLVQLPLGVGVGGDDEVSEDLSLAGYQQAVVDDHRGDVAGPLERDGDQAAARGPGRGGFSHFRLGVLQLLLHRLGLLHEGVEVFHGPKIGARPSERQVGKIATVFVLIPLAENADRLN